MKINVETLNKAKNYSKSFKEESLENIRELSYIQGAVDFKISVLEKFSKIPNIKSMNDRQGYYQSGYNEAFRIISSFINSL